MEMYLWKLKYDESFFFFMFRSGHVSAVFYSYLTLIDTCNKWTQVLWLCFHHVI